MPQHNSKTCAIATKTLSAAALTLLAGNFLFEASPLVVGGGAMLAAIGMLAKSKNCNITKDARQSRLTVKL